jgi:hypothetical protein
MMPTTYNKSYLNHIVERASWRVFSYVAHSWHNIHDALRKPRIVDNVFVAIISLA